MALFSGNRKVRARRSKSALDLKQEVSPQCGARNLTKRADELNTQIERLECFITAAPRIKRQHRLENINMVPPMDFATPAPRNRRVPIAKQRARRSERLRLLTEGLIVLGSIAAVVGWLNQWFHFWR
jgi:hypothetical protein